jgi:Mg2+ and Co2+ transporter CorA
MSDDALYALCEIFQLSAAAERQVSNLIKKQLDQEMEVARTDPSNNVSMVNFRYPKSVVDEHITKLTETALLLANRDQLNWPRVVPGSDHRAEADRVASMLFGDFTYLRHRAERVSTNVQESMQSLANIAAFQESVEAVANAERVERLTLIATILLPMTFTCSFFGMNFSVFGQGDLDIWIYVPVSIGVMLACWILWHLADRKWRFRQLLRGISSLLHPQPAL